MHVLLQVGSISEKHELYPSPVQQLQNYYVSDLQKSSESTNKKQFSHKSFFACVADATPDSHSQSSGYVPTFGTWWALSRQFEDVCKILGV